MSRKKIRRALLLAVGVACFFTVGDHAAHASDAASVVMALDGGASIVRGNTGVRSSLKRGDTIFVGDQTELSHGTKISLSFDQEGLDVMQFEGPCVIIFRTTSTVEMSNGKVLVVQDRKGGMRSLKVQTPSAVATGQNANFQVKVKREQSEVISYKSQVNVYGRAPDGSEMGPPVVVEAGFKTNVDTRGALPRSHPVPATSQDMIEMDIMKGLTLRAAQWAQAQAGDWLASRFEQKTEPAGNAPGMKIEGLKKDAKDYMF